MSLNLFLSFPRFRLITQVLLVRTSLQNLLEESNPSVFQAGMNPSDRSMNTLQKLHRRMKSKFILFKASLKCVDTSFHHPSFQKHVEDSLKIRLRLKPCYLCTPIQGSKLGSNPQKTLFSFEINFDKFTLKFRLL